jgi:hypothetical protein
VEEMNYVGNNYCGGPVHSTNNYSQYFTVAVKNASSQSMTVAIVHTGCA